MAISPEREQIRFVACFEVCLDIMFTIIRMKRSSPRGKHATTQSRRHSLARVIQPTAPAFLLPVLVLVPVLAVGVAANALPATDTTPAKPAVRSFTISDTDNAQILVSRAESRSILSDGEWETTSQVDVDGLTKEEPQPEADKDAQTADDTTSKKAKDSSIAFSVSDEPAVADVPGNSYPWSNCTWWAFIRRTQLGLPVGSHWGNGGQWADSARAAGLTVDQTPSVGAIMVFAPGQERSSSVYGHVAIVEKVNEDGSVVTSEMGIAFQGHTFSRTFSNVADFQYIH